MKRVILRSVLTVLALIGLLSPGASAQDHPWARASVSAGAVYLGDTLIYTIRVRNAAPDAPPDLPSGERLGYEAEFLSQQNKSFSSTVIVNGEITQRSEESYVLYYRLTALKTGDLSVPRVEVRADGQTLRTEPVPFRVVGASEREDLRVSLSASTDAPYVGQPVEIGLEVLIERGSSINNVVFTLPGLDERFATQESAPPRGGRRSRAGFEFLGAPAEITVDQVSVDGREYDRVRANRTIVASEPGEATLGPGVWICDFAPAGSRRGARVAVPSNGLTLDTRELPTEGRPPGFSGLIGEYRLSASAAPTDVRVGDPIRFELTLEGPGDLRRFDAPEIAGMPGFDSGFRLANRDAERLLGDGRVTFRYVVRAITDAVDAIPSVVLDSFDPSSGAYERIGTDPIPLEVQPSRVVTAVDGESFRSPATEAQRLESAPRTLGANRAGDALLRAGRFSLAEAARSPLVIAMVATPPAAYFGLLAAVAIRRRAERPAREVAIGQAARRAARELRRSSDPPADAVRRAFVRYEAMRSARSERVVTPGEAVERIRRERPGLADRAERLLEACEALRYGGRSDGCGPGHRDEAIALLGELASGGGR